MTIAVLKWPICIRLDRFLHMQRFGDIVSAIMHHVDGGTGGNHVVIKWKLAGGKFPNFGIDGVFMWFILQSSH
jgi:hypothetical protein